MHTSAEPLAVRHPSHDRSQPHCPRGARAPPAPSTRSAGRSRDAGSAGGGCSSSGKMASTQAGRVVMVCVRLIVWCLATPPCVTITINDWVFTSVHCPETPINDWVFTSLHCPETPLSIMGVHITTTINDWVSTSVHCPETPLSMTGCSHQFTVLRHPYRRLGVHITSLS